jgi:hypothetical protein
LKLLWLPDEVNNHSQAKFQPQQSSLGASQGPRILRRTSERKIVKGISGFGMKLIALDNEDCDDYFMPQLIWKFKKSDKNSFYSEL